MRKIAPAALVATSLIFAPGTARADMFGGDTIVLTQLLSNAIQQLYQLMQVVQQGRDTLGLMRDINRGINDSLQLAQTLRNSPNPGLYGDWQTTDTVLRQIAATYGAVAPSQVAQIQRDSDTVAAEGIARNRAIHDYTGKIDRIGEDIKAASHTVSPGGAQKLTAEGVGVMLHVMNESLRTQAAQLKLSSQNVAAENHREKATTRHVLESSSALKSAMKEQDTTFKTPRF
jgi:hypothetical protein